MQHVFIDTSIFVASNFDVSSTAFSTLKALWNFNYVKLISTDITIEEIRANVRKSLEESKAGLANAGSKARILRPLSEPEFFGVFQQLNIDAYFKKIFPIIKKFLDDIDTEILDATEADAGVVFDAYFNETPPFSNKKKKCEFPDAFIVQSLLEYCENENIDIIVISSDKDFEKVCEHHEKLSYIPTLNQFLDSLFFGIEPAAVIGHGVLNRHRDKIEEQIGEAFKDRFFLLEDEHGSAEVQDIQSVELTNELVIGVDENSVSFSANAEVDFVATASFGDPLMSYKDEDTKEIVYLETKDELLHRNTNETVEFVVEVDRDDQDYLYIRDVKMSNVGYICVDDDAESWYR